MFRETLSARPPFHSEIHSQNEEKLQFLLLPHLAKQKRKKTIFISCIFFQADAVFLKHQEAKRLTAMGAARDFSSRYEKNLISA
jgi:hypothetical protein